MQNECSIIVNSKNVSKYNVILPHAKDFINIIKDFKVDYSNNGNSTVIVGKKSIEEFILTELDDNNQNYVFQNILDNFELFKCICSMINIPNPELKMRISRLYIGSKGSGTHIHNHSVAINYLIDGKKLWFYFPKSKHNIKQLKKYSFEYLSIKISVIDWYNKYKNTLYNVFENFETCIQNSGESIFVPNEYYHGVINLERSIGLTFSWY